MNRILQTAKDASARRRTSTSCGQGKKRVCPVCEQPFLRRKREFKEHIGECVNRCGVKIAKLPLFSDDRKKMENHLAAAEQKIRELKL